MATISAQGLTFSTDALTPFGSKNESD